MTDLIDLERLATTTHGNGAANVMQAALSEFGAALELSVPLHGPSDGVTSSARPAQPRRPLAEYGSLIDLVLLAEITGGNVQTQAEILAEFTRVNEVDAQRLRHGVDAGDCTRVVEFSHRIKGAGLMLGATLLANSCERLETAASLKDGTCQ